MTVFDEGLFLKGLEQRKSTLGAEYVENNLAAADEFTRPFQEAMTAWCWGFGWGDDVIDAKTRSMMNLSMIGALGKMHPIGWAPRHEALLLEVMAVNRRYQRIRNSRILKQLELRPTPDGPQCDPVLSQRAKGLTYPEMVVLADKANFRHALWQIGEAIANLFAEVGELNNEKDKQPNLTRPDWPTLTRRWKKK